MSTRESQFEGGAARLRTAFDASFSAQRAPNAGAELDLLAIRVGGHGYALRLAEVLAVHAERELVPVPSPVPSLLGLIGVRGLVVPIYDLRLLLGYPAGPPPRWLCLARAASALGFAFEALEAHWRLPHESVVAGSELADNGQRFARGGVQTDAGPRPLLHLPSLIESVTNEAHLGRDRAREERR